MSIISDVFGGQGDVDENEATDLGLHVRQCARRYKSLSGKLNLVILFLILYALGMPEGLKTVLFSLLK